MNGAFENVSKPSLVEPGVKFFLKETLKQCRDFKEKYNNTLYNVGLFAVLILIIICILIYKYKGKLTPVQMEQKEWEKKQYILTKIKNYQDAKRIAHQELITGLPGWNNNEYDLVKTAPQFL
jgi:Na+-transporting NADH:ubiquinone oxidoreductase subunit NqrC